MAKRIIIRKQANGNVKRIEKKTEKTEQKQATNNKEAKQTTEEKPLDIMTLYQKKMEKMQTISSGKIAIGARHFGADCITTKSDNLQDILQEAIIKLLNTQAKTEIEKPEHLLNKAIKQCKIDHYRKEKRGSDVINTVESQKVSRFIEFNSNLADIKADSMLDDEEKTQYIETIEYIESHLKNDIQKGLFIDYFVNGLTTREISKKLDIDKMKVNRLLAKVKARIMRLKVSDLYDTRFLMPDNAEQCPSYPAFIPEKDPLDSGRLISIEEYEENASAEHLNGFNLDDTEYALTLSENGIDTPTKEKPFIDSYEYIAISRGNGIEYKKLSYQNNSKTGELTNLYGSMYKWNKVDNMPIALGNTTEYQSKFKKQNAHYLQAFGIMADLNHMWS